MNYQTWLAGMPKEFADDALWKMEVYRLAMFAGDIAWADATKLTQDRRTLSLSDQLFRSVGSVSANRAIEDFLTGIPMPLSEPDATRNTENVSHA